MTAKKRIAITGGYGFIGSALVRLLLEETDHDILNIDNLTYAANPASVPGPAKIRDIISSGPTLRMPRPCEGFSKISSRTR